MSAFGSRAQISASKKTSEPASVNEATTVESFEALNGFWKGVEREKSLVRPFHNPSHWEMFVRGKNGGTAGDDDDDSGGVVSKLMSDAGIVTVAASLARPPGP